MSKKVIIFDFDGVIVESNEIKSLAFVELFKNQTSEIQDEILSYHKSHEGISRVQKIKYFYKEFLKIELTQSELSQACDEFSRLVKKAVIAAEPVADSVQFFKKYYQDFDFYIASGTPEQELVEIVEKRRLSRFFKGVYGSPRLKEEIIESLVSQMNLDKKYIWMIGDSYTDYKAAVLSRINFVGRTHQNLSFPKEIPQFSNPYPYLEELLAHNSVT